MSLTRRDALFHLGAACTTCMSAHRLLAADRSGMTLGFSNYGMRSLSTEKALEVLSKIGFDSVELCARSEWDSAPEKMSAARRRIVRRKLDDLGLVLSAIMENVVPTGDPKEQLVVADRLKAAAQLGRDLSPDRPPLVETTLGGGKWENQQALFRDRLGSWTDLAKESGVVLAIKPHRGGALSRPSEAVWLIEQLGKPAHFRMVYDYSHYDFRDMSIEETVTTALPYTAFVAIKDAVKVDGKVRFALPGDGGRIDYRKLFGLLKAGGYRGDVNCEVSGQVWNKSGYDPVAAARRCYENVAPVFQAVAR